MKMINKFITVSMLMALTLCIFACGKNDYISTKKYDFQAKMIEVETITAPIEEELTTDMYLNQTEMNELSGDICEEWQAFLDEVVLALEENLNKKAYKEFAEEQEAWLAEVEEEVDAYVAGFGDGSMVSLLYNMEMTEKIKFRIYDLMKYFENP